MDTAFFKIKTILQIIQDSVSSNISFKFRYSYVLVYFPCAMVMLTFYTIILYSSGFM